jgi:hypothetical protein
LGGRRGGKLSPSVRGAVTGVESKDVLVIDLSLDKQKSPCMVFFRHLMLLLFAGVLLFHAFLRFEPNLLLFLFGS